MADVGSSILLIDGATGTELSRRGVALVEPLWSAQVLLDAPEVLEQIHIEYLEAGAEAITANSFRTNHRALEKAGMGDRAAELTKLAVDIARSARDKVNPKALILGSVAPLEDCYSPELSPEGEAAGREHAEHITNLLEADVDYLMLETMITRHEALAAAEMAGRLAPGRWMMSFTTKTEGPPGVLLRGTSLVDLLPMLSDAYAVGVNCIAALAMERQIRLLRTMLPDDVRVLAYANSSIRNEQGEWIDSDAADPERYAEYALRWIDAGAGIIGGCCGTTPATIAAVARGLGK